MLNMFVPTFETLEVTAPVFALSTATSTSGREKPAGTPASHTLGVGSPSSIQWVPFHWTITPTAGAGGRPGSMGGFGGDGPPNAVTVWAPMSEVRLPASSTLT